MPLYHAPRIYRDASRATEAGKGKTKVRKTLIAAACLATAIEPATAGDRPYEKFEQTRWEATCISFYTKTAGQVPCDRASHEVILTSAYNDGEGDFSFVYAMGPVAPGENVWTHSWDDVYLTTTGPVTT